MTNRGATRLRKLFPGHGGQTRLSVEIGIGQSVVSRWMRGDRKPSASNRVVLQEKYKIPFKSWDEETPEQTAGAA